MFWGSGDTSKLHNDEESVLTALRRMVETGHIVALTPEQSEMAMRALNWYERWEKFFELLASIRNTVILLTFLVGVWWTTEGRIVELITEIKK